MSCTFQALTCLFFTSTLFAANVTT
uniref:Uncharacterized protein n=1 Tax=Arundo donax TaxID=35708 RepID=A0A0A9BQW4_ARUDO